mmetsp:Transcript_37211/g.120456  ORF Transcript_37211/g.120456 Transcript_37211/m.120456 type:complete len:216 (+) Transcript_37211:199-846(+)
MCTTRASTGGWTSGLGWSGSTWAPSMTTARSRATRPTSASTSTRSTRRRASSTSDSVCLQRCPSRAAPLRESDAVRSCSTASAVGRACLAGCGGGGAATPGCDISWRSWASSSGSSASTSCASASNTATGPDPAAGDGHAAASDSARSSSSSPSSSSPSPSSSSPSSPSTPPPPASAARAGARQQQSRTMLASTAHTATPTGSAFSRAYSAARLR